MWNPYLEAAGPVIERVRRNCEFTEAVDLIFDPDFVPVSRPRAQDASRPMEQDELAAVEEDMGVDGEVADFGEAAEDLTMWEQIFGDAEPEPATAKEKFDRLIMMLNSVLLETSDADQRERVNK
jgi:hypothetical protein